MIIFRAALVALVGLVLVAVLTQTAASPPPSSPLQSSPLQSSPLPSPAPDTPTPRPTHIPLPTLAPAVITSHIFRETPPPAPTSTPSAEPEVAVVDNGFLPSSLTLTSGQSVVWTNVGSDSHDVTGSGPGGDWHSGPLTPTERYVRPFDLPGTYDYVCTIHPEMSGHVIVQP